MPSVSIETDEKPYLVLVRLPGALRPIVRSVAQDQGCSVASLFRGAMLRKLRDDGLIQSATAK